MGAGDKAIKIEEVKRNLNKLVRFKNPKLYMENSQYILTGCILRKGKDGFFYQAELTDVTNSNFKSIVIARLEEIF